MRDSFAPRLPIRTERLVLRALITGDASAVAAYRSLPDVCRFLPSGPMDEAEVRKRLHGPWAGLRLDAEQSTIRLGVEAAGVLVGDVALFVRDRATSTVELAWVLAPQHAGRGFATEAARALLDVAFADLGAHRVLARTDPRNRASAAVAERIGLRREALMLEDERIRGEWVDTALYALLEREHRAGVA